MAHLYRADNATPISGDRDACGRLRLGWGREALARRTAQLDAEALYSARTAADYAQIWSDRRLAYEYLPTSDEHWQAALNAQRSLAGIGQSKPV